MGQWANGFMSVLYGPMGYYLHYQGVKLAQAVRCLTCNPAARIQFPITAAVESERTKKTGGCAEIARTHIRPNLQKSSSSSF